MIKLSLAVVGFVLLAFAASGQFATWGEAHRASKVVVFR